MILNFPITGSMLSYCGLSSECVLLSLTQTLPWLKLYTDHLPSDVVKDDCTRCTHWHINYLNLLSDGFKADLKKLPCPWCWFLLHLQFYAVEILQAVLIKKKRKEKRQGRCEVKWWELCKTYLNSQIKSCLGLISKHSGLKPWQKTLSKTTGEVRITHAFTFFLQIFFFLPKLLQGFELLTLWAQTCLPNLYGSKMQIWK